jgi:hypothetical protein
MPPSKHKEQDLTTEELYGLMQKNHEYMLESVAATIKALTPLVAFILSDKFSAEERQYLRIKLLPMDTVFNLYNLVGKLHKVLGKLCSETARNIKE